MTRAGDLEDAERLGAFDALHGLKEHGRDRFPNGPHGGRMYERYSRAFYLVSHMPAMEEKERTLDAEIKRLRKELRRLEP